MYPRFNPAVVRLLVLMVSGPVIVSMLSVAPRHLAPMLYAAVQALLVVKSSGNVNSLAFFFELTNFQCNFQLDNGLDVSSKWAVCYRWSMCFSLEPVCFAVPIQEA